MIFAAGIGSRLKPWTDHHPKALVRVNGKTLLQRNLAYLYQAGIDEVIINVHHFAGQIITELAIHKGWGTKVSLSDEQEALLETGGGLKKAAAFFEGETDFVVMNGDILTDMPLAKMIEQHKQSGSIATLAVSERTTSRYFLFDQQQVLCGWENVKTGEKKIVRHQLPLIQKAFSGIQVIHHSLIPLITQEGKFSMVDVYLNLAKTQVISAFDHSGARLIDVGKPESLHTAENMFP